MAETDTEDGYGLSLPDSPINPFRIKPPELQMMAVLKGSSDGPLDRIIASVSGWHFRYQEPGFNPANTDEWERWELLPDIDPLGKRPTFKPLAESMPEEEFGIIWVGFIRSLHIPTVRYAKWEKPPGKTKAELVSKDREESPFFYFQYTMGIPVLEVESKGNFKTTINMNLVVRLINPYKAQFLAGGWESLLDAAVHGAVRDHLSNLTVERIRAESEKNKKDGLIRRILELNKKKGGFRDKFGVEVKDVRFVSFDVVGNKRVQEALEEQEVSRLRANAADEKAREIMTLAKAQADAAALVVASYGSGEAAASVRQAELLKEALVDTKANVVALGGNTPIAVATPTAKKEQV